MAKPRRRPRRSDPFAVCRELCSRHLNNLEACRLAWEAADDPLAVVVAVMLCRDEQCPPPPWLVEAVVVLLFLIPTHRAKQVRGLLQRLWAEKLRDAMHASRAVRVAWAKSHGEGRGGRDFPTWAESYLAGKVLGAIDSDAARKSYERVWRTLSEPGRYYNPPQPSSSVMWCPAALGWRSRLEISSSLG